MNIKIFLSLFILLTGVISCNNKSNMHTDKWDNETVKIPESAIFMKMFKDTIPLDMINGKIKVVAYLDTMGCIGCKLQLRKWKEVIDEMQSLTTDTISVLFILFSTEIEELDYLIKSESFEYPICVDLKGEFGAKNHIYSDAFFLLDNENHVVVSGNPIDDVETKQKYFENITGTKMSRSDVKTTIVIDSVNLDFGIIPINEEKELTVKLKNTGINSFSVVDVVTSCGCITSVFDKQPIKQGGITSIQFKVSATEAGVVRKTAKIFGNIDEPITVNITGIIK